MANRVIKDRIWNSPTLARLDPYIQDQLPRWLLMTDDWGCFEMDCETVKGLVYPKRPETVEDVGRIRDAFQAAGLLFVWEDEGREWGLFVTFARHNPGLCNRTQLNSSGKQVKHRRKTPAPPKQQLTKFLGQFRTSQNKTGRSRTVQDKYLNPNPNTKEKPEHKEKPKDTTTTKRNASFPQGFPQVFPQGTPQNHPQPAGAGVSAGSVLVLHDPLRLTEAAHFYLRVVGVGMGKGSSSWDQQRGFEEAWAHYPRKEGKQKARAWYMATVTGAARHNRLLKNLAGYLEACARDGTRPAPGGVFFTRWG